MSEGFGGWACGPAGKLKLDCALLPPVFKFPTLLVILFRIPIVTVTTVDADTNQQIHPRNDRRMPRHTCLTRSRCVIGNIEN